MKRGRVILHMLAAVAFMLCVAAYPSAAEVELKPEWKENPEVLWTELRKNWDENIDTYTSDILSWAYRTEWYMDEVWEPTSGDEERPDEIDWVYRIYQVKFRKPDWVLFSYNYSAHEKNTDSSDLISRAVAYVLKYTDGTTFNYGYKSDDKAYIKFPYVSNSTLAKFDIPWTMKAGMKFLMIVSRNEIYERPMSELKDPRGYSIDNLIIGLTMDRFDKFLDYEENMTITVEPSPRLGKKDYDLDKETGWLKIKDGAYDADPEVLRLTFVDSDMERCKGLNKYEAFVDPETMMFVGLHEYEKDKLVGMTQFFNMELNPELPEKLWDEEFFENREIADR